MAIPRKLPLHLSQIFSSPFPRNVVDEFKEVDDGDSSAASVRVVSGDPMGLCKERFLCRVSRGGDTIFCLFIYLFSKKQLLESTHVSYRIVSMSLYMSEISAEWCDDVSTMFLDVVTFESCNWLLGRRE